MVSVSAKDLQNFPEILDCLDEKLKECKLALAPYRRSMRKIFYAYTPPDNEYAVELFRVMCRKELDNWEQQEANFLYLKRLSRMSSDQIKNWELKVQTAKEAPILTVVSAVVSLKRAGHLWRGKSPFTDERTPSFFVDESKNKFSCYSSGKHGDAINFVRELYGYSFKEAVDYLNKI